MIGFLKAKSHPAMQSAAREFALACRGSCEPADLARAFLDVAVDRLSATGGIVYWRGINDFQGLATVGPSGIWPNLLASSLLDDLPIGRAVCVDRRTPEFSVPQGLLLRFGYKVGPDDNPSMGGLIAMGARTDGRPYPQGARALLEALGQCLQQALAVGMDLASRAEIERQGRQILQAKDVQEWMLLRELPSIEGLDLEVVSPVASALGGNFYDIVQVDHRRWGILVGEVAGTGFSAALRAAIALSYFRSAAPGTLSPEELLAIVNNLLCLYPPAIRESLTAMYAIYDRRDRSLCFATAGQSPPLLNGWPVSMAGVPLGLGRDARFPQTRVTLKPTDVLLWYTSGLLSALDPHGKPVGLDGATSLARPEDPESPIRAPLRDRVATLMGDSVPARGFTCLAMAVR